MTDKSNTHHNVDTLPESQPNHTVISRSDSSVDSDDSNLNNDNELQVAKEFNGKSLKERLKIIFSNKAYKRILPLVIVWVMAGYMPAVFLSAWGAEQFSGCTAHTAADEEEACNFNYNGYNKMQSLFSSLGGAMAFIFGGLIGRISDSYGRKPIFYVNILLSASLYAPLVISPNIWIHFIMRIPAGLNSSDNSFTPMMMAYMSDIMPEYQRTMAYSIAYAFCAIGLFVGVGLAITLGIFFGDNANFIAISILDAIQIIYCYFFVVESLKVQNRKPFTTKNLNPLRPLYHCCCYHPIVFWIAIVQFFISLPETGILDMSLIYILDQLSIENETDANITNAIFIVCCSFGLIIGPLFLLPKLQNNGYTNIQILCVGVSLFFISFLLFSLLATIKSIIIPSIGGILITSGFISFPAANGIVTKYLRKSEQGIGFGVIFAVRSLTWIIAPISFAEMYSFFKHKGIPSMTMYIAAAMILIAIIIILIPLKKIIIKTNKLGKKYSFSSVELQMMRGQNKKNKNNNDKNVNLTNIDNKQKIELEMDTIHRFETLDAQIR